MGMGMGAFHVVPIHTTVINLSTKHILQNIGEIFMYVYTLATFVMLLMLHVHRMVNLETLSHCTYREPRNPQPLSRNCQPLHRYRT